MSRGKRGRVRDWGQREKEQKWGTWLIAFYPEKDHSSRRQERREVYLREKSTRSDQRNEWGYVKEGRGSALRPASRKPALVEAARGGGVPRKQEELDPSLVVDERSHAERDGGFMAFLGGFLRSPRKRREPPGEGRRGRRKTLPVSLKGNESEGNNTRLP